MTAENNSFSYAISDFHRIPSIGENGKLAGYGALMQHYNVQCPAPDIMSAIGEKHKRYTKGRWQFFTPRHAPEDSLRGHLMFALKNEAIDLAVLKSIFTIVSEVEILETLEKEPTGAYSRRLWFLYEWLQESILPLKDSVQGNFVDLVDPKMHYTGPSKPSARHRIRNNLPGVRHFCPMIRRTEKLDHFIACDLSEKTKHTMGRIHADVLLRAAAFLLLKDSKASYVIEGENPPHSRIERWGHIIGQAGICPLSHAELLRLQRIVIGDTRFIRLGYRTEGGFVGTHDRTSGMPFPDHISARHKDIMVLMEALFETHDLLKNSDFPPVLLAALISFGFVFIHPFEDGNGRIHRYLLHHVLAETGFAPKGITFPISAVILKRLDAYREVLECYSKPRLEYITWRVAEKNNIEVQNETIDLYRYFDATKQAEFLYECVQETIEHSLPEEISYLEKYDKMSDFIKNYIDMPDRLVDMLIRFLSQHEGILSKRAKEHEFNALTDKEIAAIEAKYGEIFL